MIVVLTLGRSGSSLVMQTLKHLGADVFGATFNADPSQSHIALNPKGYFEDGVLYAKGLRSKAFEHLKKRDDPSVAFKTDLRNFVDQSATELWQNARADISCVLVSIRIPCEQARSETMDLAGSEGEYGSPRRARIEELSLSGSFLKTYRQSFEALQTLLEGDLDAYRDCTFAVDYAQARTDPNAYVKRIADCAGLDANPQACARAAANIETALYRNKETDLRETQGIWARQTGAQSAYEKIKVHLG